MNEMNTFKVSHGNHRKTSIKDFIAKFWGNWSEKKPTIYEKKKILKTVLGKVALCKHFGKPDQEGHESRPF